MTILTDSISNISDIKKCEQCFSPKNEDDFHIREDIRKNVDVNKVCFNEQEDGAGGAVTKPRSVTPDSCHKSVCTPSSEEHAIDGSAGVVPEKIVNHNIDDICFVEVGNDDTSGYTFDSVADNTNKTKIKFNPGIDKKITLTVYLYPKGFNYVFDHYRDAIRRLLTLYGSGDSKDDTISHELTLNSLKEKDIDEVRHFLFNQSIDMYRKHASHISFNTKDKMVIQRDIEKLKNDNRKALTELNDTRALGETAQREVEINMNKIRRMRDTNFVLMVVMIVIGCLIIIPILSKLGLFSKGIAIGIWAIILLVLLGYMTYTLYFKEMNRSETDYQKYYFDKPTDKQVAMSKAKATLNDSEKARCQAFQELDDELSIPNINLDVKDYISSTQPVGKKCE